MTETERRLIDLDDLTVGDLMEMERTVSENRRKPLEPPTKTGITAETIAAILKGTKR